MIIFVTTKQHRSTHKKPSKWPGMPQVKRWSYGHLFRRRTLPVAHYVFTDFDRLPPWGVELAARVYRKLRDNGADVSNDPGRYRNRHEMLSKLQLDGINTFKSWSAVGGVWPDAYPVFLRTMAAHRGPISALLPDRPACERALETALVEGYTLSDLQFIGYVDSADHNGVFTKRAGFRIADRIVLTTSVNARNWVAKYGEIGALDESGYADECVAIETGRWADALMPAFAALDIDYGRADFAVTREGRVEIFEINTNPSVGELVDHPSKARVAAHRIFQNQYIDAMRAIDIPAAAKSIVMDDDIFKNQRYKTAKRFWLEPWMP